MIREGSKGSGNHGHKGRPGKVGGSSKGEEYAVINPLDFKDYSVPKEGNKPLESYTLIGFSVVNKFLRGQDGIDAMGKPITELSKVSTGNGETLTVKEVIEGMDEATHRYIAPKNIMVYRGTRRTPDWMKVGVEFTEKGFTSTSISDYVALHYFTGARYLTNGAVYEIKVPKGQNGIFVNGEEKEFIMPRNVRYRVTKITKGKYVDPHNGHVANGIELEIIQ